MKFTEDSFAWLQCKILELSKLAATSKDIDYLGSACSYLSSEYLSYLSQLRFNPAEEVLCGFNKNTCSLSLQIKGKWCKVILYEVPLLALVSESYYRFVDKDWNHDGQRQKIKAKARALVSAECKFAEFGTRRRRDFTTQDIVMSALLEVSSEFPGYLSGTSNVYMARKYGIPPVGTVAHEWTMGVAALEGTYENANRLAMQKWLATFNGDLGIALTDTFGTRAFLANFDYSLASAYDGVRQDSGDPIKFIEAVNNHYKSLGVDPSTKVVVFSDGLNPESAILIKKSCGRYAMNCSFGIGTNFTNDFNCASDQSQKSNAVNIVIKLFKCNGKPCIKLSDSPTKHSGDPAEVTTAKMNDDTPYNAPYNTPYSAPYHSQAPYNSGSAQSYYGADSTLAPYSAHSSAAYPIQTQAYIPDPETVFYSRANAAYAEGRPAAAACNHPAYVTHAQDCTVTEFQPTTIHHCIPTYLTITEPCYITHSVPCPTTIVQQIPTSTTTTEICRHTCTTTACFTVTNTATQTTAITHCLTGTVTEICHHTETQPTTYHHTVIDMYTCTRYCTDTETQISVKHYTDTEQVTALKTVYGTCYDTIIECCPVTVCQNIHDTCYETCVKTCVECYPVTIARPCTVAIPTPVSVTETECHTVTMCQPVTVSVPVTEYDTVCQLVTVDRTATMTKPVLVVQNICTETCCPPPPPPPPHYGGQQPYAYGYFPAANNRNTEDYGSAELDESKLGKTVARANSAASVKKVKGL
ncbi:nicotinate phosphoribosyltransferase [Coemansia sp. RSA 1939]|nr:nicotinate phosphoribosyltransferase [Coemansia sp. RSA 1939]